MIAIGLVWSYAVPLVAHGAQLPAQARSEIAHLLSHVEASGCKFLRNGSWHDGRSAREHLTMKYDYMTGRGLVQSSDDFIVKVATASSMTGATYKVRCGSRPAMTSADWLREELARFRRVPATPST